MHQALKYEDVRTRRDGGERSNQEVHSPHRVGSSLKGGGDFIKGHKRYHGYW